MENFAGDVSTFENLPGILKSAGLTIVDSEVSGSESVITVAADGNMTGALDLSQSQGHRIVATTSTDPAAEQMPTMTGQIVADASTLDQLLAMGAVQLTDAAGNPLHIINIGGTSHVMRVLSVENPPSSSSEVVTFSTTTTSEVLATRQEEIDASAVLSAGWPFNLPVDVVLPSDCPSWAAKLRDCQKLGDYYRGWVITDAELEMVLTEHKQATRSMWGTRQSPCPSKETSRLMWKSQYVAFDGIPFLNVGSRAVVQECQYGPRRKGEPSKKIPSLAPLTSSFKQTCPARIYIKKVRKFVEYVVNTTLDRKQMKMDMDRVFAEIKARGIENCSYQERLYVQLPTEDAHMYHSMFEAAEKVYTLIPSIHASSGARPEEGSEKEDEEEDDEEEESEGDGGVTSSSRMHPLVQTKLRELVASGETRLYIIRKHLRKFVEHSLPLFVAAGETVDKHNLSVYPTVNDLQNHIHQAIKDIGTGVLPLNEEQGKLTESEDGTWVPVSEAHAQTVTVTLTQHSGQEGHQITKVETHMSDGTTRVSDRLTPETARLLAKLHPTMFTPDMLEQLRAGKTPALKSISVKTPTQTSSSDEGHLEQQNKQQNPQQASIPPASLTTENLRKRTASISEAPAAKRPVPTLQSASIAPLDVCNDEIDIEGMGDGVLLQDSDMSEINVTDPTSDSDENTSVQASGVLTGAYHMDDIVGFSGHGDPSILGISESHKDADAFRYISLGGQDPPEDHILVDT